MNERLRWMKFWPADWQRDPALRMCSLPARGLWVEMIALAHEADPYGHVLVSGKPPTAKQIASIVGASEKEVAKLLAELEEAGVFSRTADGVIFSRRMVRDNATRERARDFGRNGGNPALKPKAHAPLKGGVNPPDNASLKLQEAEAEAEIRTPHTPRRRGGGGGADFEEFWRLYPRKVGKGAAKRAWPKAVAAAGGDVEAILGGVKVGLAIERFDLREGGRFCPHPATWLNGERWLDGIEADEAQPSLLGTH